MLHFIAAVSVLLRFRVLNHNAVVFCFSGYSFVHCSPSIFCLVSSLFFSGAFTAVVTLSDSLVGSLMFLVISMIIDFF